MMFAVCLYAKDFWIEKEPGQWTDKEVEKMLTKSPWAKKVTPESSMSGMAGGGAMAGGGGMGGGGGPSGGGGGGMGGGGGRGGGGDMGAAMPSGGQSASDVILRWEGAAPIREANARNQFAHSDEIAQWAQEYYVISITGLETGPAGRGAPGEGGREAGGAREGQGGQREGDPRGGTPPGGDNANMAMPNFRSLLLKYSDKRTITPEKVMVLRTTESLTFYILFSRKDAITVADKDITFEAAVDQLTIKSKFKLKDMQYKGKLEL